MKRKQTDLEQLVKDLMATGALSVEMSDRFVGELKAKAPDTVAALELIAESMDGSRQEHLPMPFAKKGKVQPSTTIEKFEAPLKYILEVIATSGEFSIRWTNLVGSEDAYVFMSATTTAEDDEEMMELLIEATPEDLVIEIQQLEMNGRTRLWCSMPRKEDRREKHEGSDNNTSEQPTSKKKKEAKKGAEEAKNGEQKDETQKVESPKNEEPKTETSKTNTSKPQQTSSSANSQAQAKPEPKSEITTPRHDSHALERVASGVGEVMVQLKRLSTDFYQLQQQMVEERKSKSPTMPVLPEPKTQAYYRLTREKQIQADNAWDAYHAQLALVTA